MGTTRVNIINVASDLGSVYTGKSRAPAAFKDAGLRESLQSAGLTVTGSTALPESAHEWIATSREPNGARNEAPVVDACHQVHQSILASLNEEDVTANAPTFQLILSGECLFCPAILSAYWRRLEGTGKRVGILYMDADCDLYTPVEATGTGNIAGMTLTHLTLRQGSLDSMKAFSRPDGSGVVDSNNIVLFGLNVDSSANQRPHLGYLFDNMFRVVTSTAAQKAPIDQAAAALKWLEDRVDIILVHLDVDVIDPGLFPLGNVPNYTGLGFQEAMAALKTFLQSEKVVGLSVAEVNPDHDPGLKMTKHLINELVDGIKGRAKN